MLTSSEMIKYLTQTKKLLITNWGQGKFDFIDSNEVRRYCAYGAILKVVCDAERNEAKAETVMELKDWVEKCLNKMPITQWNDTPGRKQAEVTKTFNKAIALVRSSS